MFGRFHDMRRPWLQCNNLLSAIEFEDVKAVTEVIDGGFDVDTILLDGKSAISICLERGKTKIAQLLLRRGCSLSLKTPNGDYPLHLAVQKRDNTLVQMLLNNGIDVTAVNLSGKTALHMACEINVPDIGRALIDRSTVENLNAVDRDGRTPLIYACEYGIKEVVEYLLEKGSRVNVADKCGESPLLRCINMMNTPETMQCLLNAGANVDHKNFRGECALVRALECTYSYQCGGRTESERQFRSMALMLIDHGCNVRIRNIFNQSPLHLAVYAKDEIVTKVLLNAGCDIDMVDDLGLSPVYYACRDGNKKILELLVEGGANLRLCNWIKLKMHFEMTNSWALVDYLYEKSKEVQPLRALCRSVIRKNLTKRIEKHAKFLPLPVPLINYIIQFDTECQGSE